jgi:iron complex outermembrane recepter protein
VFTVTQPDLQGVSGFNSGNPNLNEEKSRSITAGVVINPVFIPGLRNLVLSADYYNIRVDDAIAAAPRQFTLDQCYQFGQQASCDLIFRRATQSGANSPGSLEFVNAPQINSGEFKVEGIDFTATYRTSLDRLMKGVNMSARLAWTHILEGYLIPLPGSDKDPFAGEIGTSKDRVNGTLAFNTEKLGWSLTGTYIGKAYEDDQFLAQFGAGPKAIKIPAEFYLDTQISFRPSRKYEFYFGVDNLLDNDPPKILTGTPFNIVGADTASDVYDVYGRRYYAGVRLRL